jgi:hypothetical protein
VPPSVSALSSYQTTHRVLIQVSNLLQRMRSKENKMRTQSICLALAIVVICPFASAQWEQLGLSDRSIGDIAVGSSGLFALTSDSGSVYRSPDGGVNWSPIAYYGGRKVAVAPNGIVFVVKEGTTQQDSLYRSSDGGNTWSNLIACDTLFPHAAMNVAVAPSGRIFCGFGPLPPTSKHAFSTNCATSTDGGSSWIRYEVDSCAGEIAFAFSGHWVITAGSGCGGLPTPGWTALYVSSNDGQSWIRREWWGGSSIMSLAVFANGNILCGTNAGLFSSSDSGASVTLVGTVFSEDLLTLPQGGVLVGTDTTGIYLFSDNGDSIKTLNEGLTDLHVHTIALDGVGYVYAGTNNGIWRRPLSQVVSVSQPPEFPTAFRLDQNYPNPFNPTTTIEYSIGGVVALSEPRASSDAVGTSRGGVEGQTSVKLVIYDLLGRQVAVLVNERKMSGTYEVKFDGTNLASGVYFYRLQAGDFVQTRKCIYMR